MTNKDMKRAVLNDMLSLQHALGQKMSILIALDQDETASSCADLHDQLTCLCTSIEKTRMTIQKSIQVNGN